MTLQVPNNCHLVLANQIPNRNQIYLELDEKATPPQKEEIVIIPFLLCLWLTDFWICFPLTYPNIFTPEKVCVVFLPSTPINMLHMIIPFAQTVVGHYLVCWAHSSCILMILDHPCYLRDLSHYRKNNADFLAFQKIWFERSHNNFC